MTTTWRSWPSIENSYHKKNLSWWLERHPELIEAKYVITEKLHGSNVQINVEPSQKVSFGTRNQYVTGSALFGWPANFTELIDAEAVIMALVNKAKQLDTDVTLYGEIFGPGIQKGVYYGEHKQLRFFGLRFADELQSFHMLVSLFLNRWIVPLVGIMDGLVNALEFDTEFDSLLLDREDNLCEGVVIQPAIPVRDGDSYFMLKKKNEAFEEKQKAKKIYVPDEVVDPLNLAFRDYITEQRMNNVFSKEGPIDDMKDIGRYIRLILTDAIEDFSKDHPEIESLDKKQHKSIFNVGSAIAKMLLASLG